MVINQSINQSVDQSINQSINQSVNQSINQSIDQSINQKTLCGSFTPKMSSVILPTVCHAIHMMLVLGICYWINLQSPSLNFSSFSSLACLILYCCCKEKFCLAHSWDSRAKRREYEGNDRQLKKPLIVKQFTPVNSKGNVWRTVWGIYILISGYKG